MFKKVQIIAVGKNKTDCLDEAIAFYSQRVSFQTQLNWTFIPHGSRGEETEKIRQILEKNPAAFLVLLDERGREFSSPRLAETFAAKTNQGFSEAIFIIGGAYGVEPELLEFIQQKQGLIWSLSPLVFPHQLVRVILLEQIYRCQSILSGNHYHHS